MGVILTVCSVNGCGVMLDGTICRMAAGKPVCNNHGPRKNPNPIYSGPDTTAAWVARVFDASNDETGDDETEANARLIAAAPDLLAALEAMLEAFPPPSIRASDGFARNRAHATARTAIAKATSA